MFKAQQVLQDSYTKVLNQVKDEAGKDEETIKELKYQNAELLFQMAKKSEETSEFKSIIKNMQQLTEKLNSIVTTANKEKQPKKEAYFYTVGATVALACEVTTVQHAITLNLDMWKQLQLLIEREDLIANVNEG